MLTREHEVKILYVDRCVVSDRIISLGGVLDVAGFQRRNVYDVPGLEGLDAWLRLREDGEMTTLAFKMRDAKGVLESEKVVDDFRLTDFELKKYGIQPRACHETHRELYCLDDANVSFDTWPGLLTFLEVEAETVERMWEVVILLGFDSGHVCFKHVVDIYRDLGWGDIRTRNLLFSDEERERLSGLDSIG